MHSTIRRVTTVPPAQGPLTTPRTIYLLPAATNNVQAPVQLQTKTLLVPRPSGVLIRTAADSMVIRQNRVQEAVKSSSRCSPSPVKPEITLKRASTIPIEEILNETCSQSAMPRKRERLTHLTAEEKMSRRKLKNRVAAQTARDRKKERTSRLEDAVRRLFEENERLRTENVSLRGRMERLEAKSESENVKDAKCMTKTFGSAASISGPQQREQVNKSCTVLPTLLYKGGNLVCLMALLFLMPNSSRTSSQTFKRSTSTRCVPTCFRTTTVRNQPAPRRLRVGMNIRVRSPRSLWGRVS